MNNATPTTSQPPGGSRLNLLLSYGGWRETTAIGQLPQLLAPMGIYSIRVETGEEAAHATDEKRAPAERRGEAKSGSARRNVGHDPRPQREVGRHREYEQYPCNAPPVPRPAERESFNCFADSNSRHRRSSFARPKLPSVKVRAA